MKIAVDGGALCSVGSSRFGNYTFTKNLLFALSLYDHKNDYLVYSFCPPPRWFQACSLGYRELLPKTAWMSIRVGIEEMIEKSDVFLAVNQAAPFFKVNKPIYFSHGLSFLHFPKLYYGNYLYLKNQTDKMARKAAAIIVSSERVRQEWITHYPGIKNVFTLPFGVPFDVSKPNNAGLRERYFLFVGMNHPIKNIRLLVDCFGELVKDRRFYDFKLKLVGNFNQFKQKKNIEILTDVSRENLNFLYQKAAGYIAVSHYESFNYPVLEALSMGCPVINYDDFSAKLKRFQTPANTFFLVFCQYHRR